MNRKVLQECLKASLEGSMPFAQIVGRLIDERVESYHVDLVRSEIRYYSASGEHAQETIPLKFSRAADKFKAEDVKSAIKDSQAGKIGWTTFLDRAMAAGCVYYVTYLTGKRVVYLGREGDAHVENFPRAK